MQPPDHAERKIALPIQHFGDTGARAKDRLEVAAREALLLHAKLDRLDGIRRIDRMMFALIGVDAGGEDVEPVALGRPGLRPIEALDLR